MLQSLAPSGSNVRPIRDYSRIGYSTGLVLVTAAYLVAGLLAGIAWRFTGEDSWIVGYFQIPAALMSLGLAAVQFCFCVQVLRRFEHGDQMYPVWLSASGCAGFNLAGVLFSQILSVDSAINPLTVTSLWSRKFGAVLYDFGHLLGGTGRFALLAISLWLVLGIYRRHGLLARPKLSDWIMFALMAAYVVSDLRDMIAASSRRTVDLLEIVSWFTEPLMLLLLVTGVLLYRSNRAMGPNIIERCWNAYALGIVLICVGLGALWAGAWGYLPWPYSSLFWYVWLPADAAFAVAPIYQLEAIKQASLPLRTEPVN
jgi:hypothetical protein